MKFLGFGRTIPNRFSFEIWTSFSKSSQTPIDFVTLEGGSKIIGKVLNILEKL